MTDQLSEVFAAPADLTGPADAVRGERYDDVSSVDA